MRDEIRAEAERLGFSAFGVAALSGPWPESDDLAQFLAEGRQGQMTWLAETFDRRRHPNALWPEVRCVIMLGLNYGPDHNPLDRLADTSRANISVYAQGDDYHEVIKKRLKALGRWMGDQYGAPLKVFVDTAPLMEKPLAARAGLGWQGKHTNLVSRAYGSWLFLGAVATGLELPPDPPEVDHCGSCSACLDICPTQALTAAGQIDARLCISYLTIEHRGPAPEALRPFFGNRVYGCDDCLAVCPWNKFAQASAELAFAARAALASPRLGDLLGLDDQAFRHLFAKSPVKRLGRDRFVRNLLYAAGNSSDPNLIAPVRALLADPDLTVADAAQWALKRLA